MNCGYYPDSMSNSEYESEFGDDSGIPGLGYSGSEDGYLHDLYRGARDPGPKILKHLGLKRIVRRVVTYVPIGTKEVRRGN